MGSTIQTYRAASRAGSSTLSSDSQPKPLPSPVSRSCSNRSTAISASQTGEEPALVQLLIGVRNIESASAPASRTQVASHAAAGAGSTTSVAGNGHTLD